MSDFRPVYTTLEGYPHPPIPPWGINFPKIFAEYF
jgi:hypothetical protein